MQAYRLFFFDKARLQPQFHRPAVGLLLRQRDRLLVAVALEHDGFADVIRLVEKEQPVGLHPAPPGAALGQACAAVLSFC